MHLKILLCIVCLVALPQIGLMAQSNFEGVITMKTGMSRGKGEESRLWIKGSRMRLDRSDGTLIKNEDGKVVAIRNGARQYLVLGTLTKPLAATFEPTGRSETVAGYACKYYRFVHASGAQQQEAEGCVTTALGFATVSPGGAPWADEFTLRKQFKDGFVLLKGIDDKGATTLEVTKVERRAVRDDMFAPPAGYTEMKIPGGMGRKS